MQTHPLRLRAALSICRILYKTDPKHPSYHKLLDACDLDKDKGPLSESHDNDCPDCIKKQNDRANWPSGPQYLDPAQVVGGGNVVRTREVGTQTGRADKPKRPGRLNRNQVVDSRREDGEREVERERGLINWWGGPSGPVWSSPEQVVGTRLIESRPDPPY